MKNTIFILLLFIISSTGYAQTCNYFKDGDGDSFGSAKPEDVISIPCFVGIPSGYVTNYLDCDDSIFNSTPCSGNELSDNYEMPSNKNYIITKTYKKEFTSVVANPEPDKATVAITYFDGLGRPIQKIAKQQSANSKDIITAIEYDALGRQNKEYLSIAGSTKNLIFDSNAITNTIAYYSSPNEAQNGNPNFVEATTNPYSIKIFETSPLSRILQHAAPGNDWSLSNNHTIKLDYQTNSVADSVKLYSVTTTWNTPIAGIYNPKISTTPTYYPSNELYKTITKDENWKSTDLNNKTTQEFKDKEGRIVLKRTFNAGLKHDTYYIYDLYGNLSYVIPPKAVDLINKSSTDKDITSSIILNSPNILHLKASNSIRLLDGFNAKAGSTFSASIVNNFENILNDLCYQYKYDYRNRLVEKKLPGKQWEFIVYDKLNRVVASGPALSPFNDLTSAGWLITKYDVFGRVIYTGWTTTTPATANGRITYQTLQNNATILYEKKLSSGTIDGIDVYYSNTTEPKNFKLLTVNYYDNYEFPSKAPQIPIPTTIESQTVLTTGQVKNLTTASWVRTLTSSTSTVGETSATFYDFKARPIQTYKQNFLGGYTQTNLKLDFSGATQYSITFHKHDSISTLIKTTDTFLYTPQGRLLSHTHKINNDVPQLLSLNTYDELGQLISKKTGNVEDSPSQTIDYTYNIRGWLKGINNTGGNNTDITLGTGDLFGFQINYNDITDASKRLYNGNISQTIWKTTSQNPLGYPISTSYVYSYDALNRLLTAVDNTTNYNETINYDKNGNITNLTRKGNLNIDATTFGNMDILSYYYNGNQLHSVTDTAASTGFTDGNTSDSSFTTTNDNDYSYDLYGNMTIDKNKGIINSGSNAIIYNHLNLPTKIIMGNKGNILYIYNATGQKLQKIVNQVGKDPLVTDYLDGYQYEKKILQFFPTSEGYVESNGNPYKYIYQYKDHLGNIRLSYDKNLVIQTENNYYPFGLKHEGYNTVKNGLQNKYKFNGKEMQDELGLNEYDYGFRHYMPDIARWGCMDAHSESYFQLSPYNYTKNNPVNMIDLLGLDPVYKNGKYYDQGKEVDFDYVLNWIGQIDGIAANYSFKTNEKGDAELVGVSRKSRRDNTFIFDKKKYTANSYMTLMGRDDGNNAVGDFKNIVDLEDGYISQILGQAAYVFYDMYKGDVEGAIFKQSLGGILDYKNELYKMFDFDRRSLVKINGIVYNPNEAGNFLWGMVLEYYGGVISPNKIAQWGTRGRDDERWEQKAISAGRVYGEKLYQNKTKKSQDLILKHRLSNR